MSLIKLARNIKPGEYAQKHPVADVLDTAATGGALALSLSNIYHLKNNNLKPHIGLVAIPAGLMLPGYIHRKYYEHKMSKEAEYTSPSIKPSHKGRLHKALGIPEGEPIPHDRLMAAKNSDNPAVRRMANFAINFHH